MCDHHTPWFEVSENLNSSECHHYGDLDDRSQEHRCQNQTSPHYKEYCPQRGVAPWVLAARERQPASETIRLGFNDEIGRGLKAAYEKDGEAGAMRFLSELSHKELQEYEIKLLFELGWEMGLKGITIYRDGSREEQPLSKGHSGDIMKFITPRPRPEHTTGVTHVIITGCGKLYVTVNWDSVGLCEVFAQLGKTGGCAASQVESTGRIISLLLRSGVGVEAIIKQITGIRCPNPHRKDAKQVLSCPDAIAQVLARVAQRDLPDSGSLAEEEGGLICEGAGERTHGPGQ